MENNPDILVFKKIFGGQSPVLMKKKKKTLRFTFCEIQNFCEVMPKK